jgi:hypothetical protein
MKVLLKFSIKYQHKIVDLEDYGHEPEVKLEDLSSDQLLKIETAELDKNYVTVEVETNL